MDKLPEELAALLPEGVAEGLEAKPKARAHSVRKFTCPSCGGEINLRALGHTLTAVCAHCSSVIDTGDERLRVVQEISKKVRKTFLEIGTRGTLKGTLWEVIGYAHKCDRTRQYFWDEYLLFNPYQGFRFLVQMDGHWNFIKVIKETFDKPGFNVTIWEGDKKFEPFLSDQPIVHYVKGEFYWRVKRGDSTTTEDYICPPWMLSFEYTGSDTTVSMCEYLDPFDIQAGFNLRYEMPRRTGVGPSQPSPYRFKKLAAICAMFLLFAMIIHGVNVALSARELLTRIDAVVLADERGKPFISPAFTVSSHSNIGVTSHAAVSNSWAEIDIALVNSDTKEVFEVTQIVQYYFGYDSEGAWNEGGTVENDYLSSVPPGTYNLIYAVDSELFRNRHSQAVSITLRRDVPSWGNFWWTLLFILLCPLYTGMRAAAFENKRWENSDFPRMSSGDE